jgi:DNA-binding MarR family transcriptional regulator
MNTDGIISLIAGVHGKAARFLVREMEARGMKGLVTSHGDILALLFRQGSASMKELAEAIGRDKSTVTALVDKLLEQGYVEKARDADDSRVALVSLTRKGRALEPHFREISEALLSGVFRGFSRAEKETVTELLRRLRDNL